MLSLTVLTFGMALVTADPAMSHLAVGEPMHIGGSEARALTDVAGDHVVRISGYGSTRPGQARPPCRTSETKERWMSPAATAPAFVDKPGSALVLVSGYSGYSTKMDDSSGSCPLPPTSRTIRGR
jgi:hypothetical protein